MFINQQTIWKTLQTRLFKGQSIDNWTVLKGYLGDNFLIEEITNARLKIYSVNAKNLISVPRGDFERFCDVWPAYRNGRMRRQETTEITRFSKYIISIFHMLETEIQG